jgi:hypothetical protein
MVNRYQSGFHGRSAMNSDAIVSPGTAADGAVESQDVLIEDDAILTASAVEIRDEREDDGRYVLYDPEREVVLAINSPGRAILGLCDGRRTVREIISALQECYEVPPTLDLRAEVLRYIDTLSKTGLLTVARTRP